MFDPPLATGCVCVQCSAGKGYSRENIEFFLHPRYVSVVLLKHSCGVLLEEVNFCTIFVPVGHHKGVFSMKMCMNFIVHTNTNKP